MPFLSKKHQPDRTTKKKAMTNLMLITDLNNGYFSIILFATMIISATSGILIIISKNPIVSVLFLILLFSTISCNLIFMGITFIGISYLLVYVGAVSILFLFILMLINIRVSELLSDTNNNIPLAILTILAFFIPISSILPNKERETSSFFDLYTSIDNKAYIKFVSSNYWDDNIVNITDITSIGNIMYTSYSIWLIITSIILLLAMVGSIVITINQKS